MAENDDTGNGGDGGFVPPQNQAELDKVIGQRLKRLRQEHSAEVADLTKRLEAAEAATGGDRAEADKLSQTVKDLTERLDKSEREALRLSVASAKGLTPGQAKRLVGATREELEDDADEILSDFPAKAAETKNDADGGDGSTKDSGPPTRRPTLDTKELEGGSAPGSPREEMDPMKLAESVPRA